MNKQNRNWIVDVIFWLGFLAAFFLDLTGVVLHQWLGIALGAYALYHLILHGSWVQAVTRRFFGKTSWQARIYYLLDAALGLGFATMIATGVVISTWLNLDLSNYSDWRDVHVFASAASMALLVLKLGLHGNWIVNTAKRLFAPAPKLQPVPAVQNDRRYVLALMGITTAAAGVALLNAFDTTSTVQASATDNASSLNLASAASVATGSTSSSSASTSSTAYTVRCKNGCSYPGRCRKYVDANKNSKCDLGECL